MLSCLKVGMHTLISSLTKENTLSLWRFALRYFKDTSPVFQRLFLESSDANPVRYGRRRMKLRDLMEAAYKFLQQEQSVFRELWDWSVCVPLLRSHDTLVRWYVALGLSSASNMRMVEGRVELCAWRGKGNHLKFVILVLVPLAFYFLSLIMHHVRGWDDAEFYLFHVLLSEFIICDLYFLLLNVLH